MNWEDYAKRRRMDLSIFLNDSDTEEEALKKFERKGIDNFPAEDVKKYYENLIASKVQPQDPKPDPQLQETVTVDKVTAPKSTKAKSGTGTV